MTIVTWTQTKFRLDLSVTLDWKKYQESSLVLPPQELGRCKEWRFEVSTDETSAIFVASWGPPDDQQGYLVGSYHRARGALHLREFGPAADFSKSRRYFVQLSIMTFLFGRYYVGGGGFDLM